VARSWDTGAVVADVVVVGAGAAGVCAALEARAAGVGVLLLDRFGGGGATALSGGVVYAGGGTPYQQRAGVSDSSDAMLAYLRSEAGDVVPDAALTEFCAGSVAMLAWLEAHGVPFDASLCPYKTSYPTNRHYLYYSGSELSARSVAPPAPRGHRTHGRGTSGKLLYARLARAARGAGVALAFQTTATALVTDDQGHVTGVECRSMRAAPGWARAAHRVLHSWSSKPYLYVPKLGRVLHRPVAALERRYARPLTVRARRGVVLAAGGFGANRAMLRQHAPQARGALPLATPGDDGSGIRLGAEAGGEARHLDRVSVWRFLTPPPGLTHGILVDQSGQRISDEPRHGPAPVESRYGAAPVESRYGAAPVESRYGAAPVESRHGAAPVESRYGAAIGAAILARGGKAWLLADRATLAEARREIRRTTLWFQRLQARHLLGFGPGLGFGLGLAGGRGGVRVTGRTLREVASKAGVDPDGLAATVAAHNEAASSAPPGADPVGKPPDQVRRQDQPPYALIDCSIAPRLLFPAPVLTLGGLVVDPQTGQVLRPDGTPVPGLYAAGRNAVGICSGSYVSGLSIADCVFSGRRAGRHAAAPPPP
jgi:3-oxo-5alpha-steroid 4-dehydrogenase